MRKVSSVMDSSFRNLINSALSLGDSMAFCKLTNVSLHDTLIFSSCLNANVSPKDTGKQTYGKPTNPK